MAARRKLVLSDFEILRALEEGESTASLALRHHCTPQAVRWRLRQMRRHLPAPAARRADETLTHTLDAWRLLAENLESLRKLKEAAEILLESAEHEGFEVGPHDYDLEVTVLVDGVPVKRTVNEILRGLEVVALEGKFADPRLLLIQAAREIRQQIEAGIRLTERVHNLAELATFQQEVLDAIAECEPHVAARIRGKLVDRRTLRLALEPPGPGPLGNGGLPG